MICSSVKKTAIKSDIPVFAVNEGVLVNHTKFKYYIDSPNNTYKKIEGTKCESIKYIREKNRKECDGGVLVTV